jgi:hypothetical protein
MVISRTTPVLKVNLLIRLWLSALKIFIAIIPENSTKKPGAWESIRHTRIHSCSPVVTDPGLYAAFPVEASPRQELNII